MGQESFEDCSIAGLGDPVHSGATSGHVLPQSLGLQALLQARVFHKDISRNLWSL